MQRESGSSEVEVRRATADDAQAIGALFDATVQEGWTYRGIGRTLLSAARDALRDAGCQQAYLFTHEQNERALTLYESAGYRRDGSVRESDFGGTAIRELRLVKQL